MEEGEERECNFQISIVELFSSPLLFLGPNLAKRGKANYSLLEPKIFSILHQDNDNDGLESGGYMHLYNTYVEFASANNLQSLFSPKNGR